MIEVPSHLAAVIEAGGTVVTPTRQRAHALRLAHAAAQLARGRRVWPSPDVLPLEGWLTREFERRVALEPDAPRLLRSAEEWLLWRECTAAATGHLALVNPGTLAEPPEDWTGPVDDVEVDDLGYSETDMQAEDWEEPLESIRRGQEEWEDAREDSEKDPQGDGLPPLERDERALR